MTSPPDLPTVNVDKCTTRERTNRLGLTWREDDGNLDGFVVYSSIYPQDPNHNYVRVINMKGEQVHSWDLGTKKPGLWSYMPDPECYSRYSTEKGLLLTITQLPPEEMKHQHSFLAWQTDHGGCMELVDFFGKVIWTHKDEFQHHDARLTRTGMLVYLANEVLDNKDEAQQIIDIAARHRGFPMAPQNLTVYSDVIKMVDPLTGKLLFSWRAAEHLDPEIDMLNFNDPFDEWNHGNTVVPLYENSHDRTELTHILVSFRQISTIVKIDAKSGDFIRLLRTPFISQQHDCSSLEEGNTNRILVFDNRYVPNDFAPTSFSVVVEFDLKEQAPFRFFPILLGPKTKWVYSDGVGELYSAYISGAQRIPGYELTTHGCQYTLITEGMKGRMFIVKTTPAPQPGERMENRVIWEYMNPEIAPGELKSVILGRSSVFRSRYVFPSIFSPEQLNLLNKNKIQSRL